MNDRAAIEQLARLVGIEAHYTDTFGRSHKASDETLLALIGAFGLPADPAVARHELAERQRRAPLGLGPVHFVDAEAAHPGLVLHLPNGCREISWMIRLESGEERSGRLAAASGEEAQRIALALPAGLPLGHHRLDLDAGGVAARLGLVVAQAGCHLPAELGRSTRSWGLTVCAALAIGLWATLLTWQGLPALPGPAPRQHLASTPSTRCLPPNRYTSALMRRRAGPTSITFTSTSPLCPVLPRMKRCAH